MIKLYAFKSYSRSPFKALSASRSLEFIQSLRSFLTSSPRSPILLRFDKDGKKFLDLIGQIAVKQLKSTVIFTLNDKEQADYSSDFPQILLVTENNDHRLLKILKSDDAKGLKNTEMLLTYPVFKN